MRVNFDDVKIPIIADFVVAQRKDSYCHQMNQSDRKPISAFIFNQSKFLAGKTALDGSIENVMPINLHLTKLGLAHHCTLAVHPDERQIYESVRSAFYWPKMAAEVHNTVEYGLNGHRMETKFHN